MIYLSKGGQSFGPFTPEEFVAMRTRGELSQYSWIWDERTQSWKALAPPAPPSADSSDANSVHVEREVPIDIAPPKRKAEKPKIQANHIEAVCYDLRNFLNGKIREISDNGCEFVTDDDSTGTLFSKQAPVTLNLLDSKSGRSMNVAGKLTAMARQNGNWIYKIRWSECPAIVA